MGEFEKKLKDNISLFGSDKLKKFLQSNPKRKNIRYFIWERLCERNPDTMEKYVLWCDKMWSQFRKETGYQYPTPIVHVLFDNWLIEQTNIL